MNDVMAAYKFYYINKNSFGGDMTSFNSYYRDAPYLNESAIKLLKKAHERLKQYGLRISIIAKLSTSLINQILSSF